MTAVILKNSHSGQAPPPAPLHDDRTNYAYCMFFEGGKHIAYGDTPEELLDAIVSGYAGRDEDGQIEARIRLAVSAQVWMQALINADTDPGVLASLSDEERAILNGSRVQQPRIDFWDPEVPLVLVETGYAPYTGLDRPISGISDVVDPPNIIWLRPQDEWEFLVSLHSAGYIGLHAWSGE